MIPYLPLKSEPETKPLDHQAIPPDRASPAQPATFKNPRLSTVDEAEAFVRSHMYWCSMALNNVEKELLERGLAPERARVVVQKIIEMRRRSDRDRGLLEIVAGVFVCIAGCAIMLFNYLLKASSPAGFKMASTAIVVGALMLLLGIWRATGDGRYP